MIEDSLPTAGPSCAGYSSRRPCITHQKHDEDHAEKPGICASSIEFLRGPVRCFRRLKSLANGCRDGLLRFALDIGDRIAVCALWYNHVIHLALQKDA